MKAVPPTKQPVTIVVSLATLRRNVAKSNQVHLSVAERHRRRERGTGRPVHNVDQVDNTDQHRQEAGDDEDKYIFSVNTMHNNQKPIFLVKINGTPVKMLGDTGAPLNIISEKAFNQISPLPPLHNADTKLFAYGPSTKALPIIGMFDATLSSNYATVTAKVYVTDGQDCALLSRMSSEALKLITVHHE